ncbi:MAG TPA: Pr6Pr family membrane protein [Alphaproteobacteria bacterium]|jgi:hypothetical protein|nr:Pr6Pr family membrane protein [Alphaproteobacteria bacterium]
MDDRFSANARAFAGLIAFAAWVGLVVQFGSSTAALGSVGAAAWHLARFFTILTNIALAATFTGVALGKPAFGGPSLLGGMTMAILLVGAVYSLLLAGTQVLTGADRYANVVMHYVMPILATLFWLIYVPKGALRARDPLIWAAYPLAYLAYVLMRGGIDGEYPYFFLNVGKIGWAAAMGNAAGISAGFLVAGYLVVALDRRLAKAVPAALSPLEPAPPGA